MDLTRTASGAAIVVTGVGLSAPGVASLLAPGEPFMGRIVALVAGLIGLGLALAGAWIVRSDLRPNHALRIAGWNALGLVVLGGVLLLASLYPGLDLPPPVVAAVLGVSAVAHVLIGINDVRRIRAEALAREREKLSVLNRLVRHNLRHEGQLLLGYAERLTDGGSGDDGSGEGESLADEVRAVGRDLGAMSEKVNRVQAAIEAPDRSTDAVDVESAVAGAVEAVRAAHPGAELSTEVPEGLCASADDGLRDAIEELVENAVVHGGEAPRVRVSAVEDGGSVEITVADDGPGVPEREREVVLGEREITQLEHGSGLGLWLSKWVVEGYGGSLSFGETGDGWNAVRVRLPGA